MEEDNDDAIEYLIEEGKAERLSSKEFKKELLIDLENDLNILREIKSLWSKIKRDPKLLSFVDELKKDIILKKNKIIIFSESKETADYLTKNIDKYFPNQIICYTGASGEATRELVIENFDAKAKSQKNDFRILICTEVLSEGVNLHRSNVVINYDLPWNPTRMMQRVGRINRVDTKFEKIYTYNFFPTKQSNDQIKLKEAAEAKINAFLSLLGGDANLLTENEPIGSHELFDRLNSKKTITGEDEEEESDLKYLNVIKDVREGDPDLFEKIKNLPKKSRTAKFDNEHGSNLLTYFRRGKVQKFFITKTSKESRELDFVSAVKILETKSNTKRQKIEKRFYELLEKNKESFVYATTEELLEVKKRGGRDSATQILRILKATLKDRRQFTDEQELYLKKIINQIEEGGLPKQTSKNTLKALNSELKRGINPLKILGVLESNISKNLLKEHYAETGNVGSGKREVVLSEYLIKK